MITIPNKKYFSDERVRKTFDKRIIKTILDFDDILPSFLNQLNYLSSTDLHYNLLYKKHAKKISHELKKEISFENKQTGQRHFFDELWRISNKKKRCEICNKRCKHFQKAHIIKKSAFKNHALKPRDAWGEYINSIANIMLVCGTCHDNFDNHYLTKSQIRYIIRKRKSFNNRLLKFIQKDIDYMHDVIYELETYEKSIDKLFANSMKKFLSRKTKLSKRLIREIIQ